MLYPEDYLEMIEHLPIEFRAGMIKISSGHLARPAGGQFQGSVGQLGHVLGYRRGADAHLCFTDCNEMRCGQGGGGWSGDTLKISQISAETFQLKGGGDEEAGCHRGEGGGGLLISVYFKCIFKVWEDEPFKRTKIKLASIKVGQGSRFSQYVVGIYPDEKAIGRDGDAAVHQSGGH